MDKARVLGEIAEDGKFTPQEELEVCECGDVIVQESYIRVSKNERVVRVVELNRPNGTIRVTESAPSGATEFEFEAKRCPRCGKLLKKSDEN